MRDLIPEKVHGRGLVWGRIRGGSLPSQTLSNGGNQETIVFHRLASESKETEEDERTKDIGPLCDLKPCKRIRRLAQHDSGDLVDTGIFRVDAIPGDPWANASPDVQDKKVSGQGDGETEIDGGQSDEAPVVAVSQVAVGGDQVFELLPSPREGTDGEDWMQ